ncbi:zinc finger, CCHC-type containing protein [Tanacetum coccineum]
MTKAKGDGGKGLYVRGRSGRRDIKQDIDSVWSKSQERSSRLRCYICQSEEHLKRDCPRYNHKKSQGFVRIEDQESGYGADGYDSVDVMAMSVEEILDWIMDSGGSYHITYMRDYLVDFEEYDGGKILLGDGRECVYRGQRSTQQCTKSGVTKHLGVVVIQQQNGLVKEMNVTLMLREDSNEAAFAVAEAEKIYAHESLTFNNTVACEVISKWKAGLKDDMDARSDVYVLSNGCKKCSDDNDVYYWEYTPAKGNVLGMEIVRDQSGNTLRVSQSRFYNGKLVQTLLEGHSILSLEGSLSRDCDVEKNGKWSCIYAVGSQEYQIVCTRLDIASANLGIYTYGGCKGAIWLKGLAIESGFELKIVADIATGALSKDIPGLKFQHRLNLLSIGIG